MNVGFFYVGAAGFVAGSLLTAVLTTGNRGTDERPIATTMAECILQEMKGRPAALLTAATKACNERILQKAIDDDIAAGRSVAVDP